MIRYIKYNEQDYLKLYGCYSGNQCFIEPATAILLGSAIVGGSAMGSSVIGGMMGGKTKSTKIGKMSTFTDNQKLMNRYLMDFMLGIKRDGAGKEISRDPLLNRAFNRKFPQMRTAPLTQGQQGGLKTAQALLGRVGNYQRPDDAYIKKLARGYLPGSANPRFAALGASLQPGEKAVVGEDGAELIEVKPDGSVQITPNPKSVSSPANIAQAMAKSEKAKIKYGAGKGFATGTPRRLWQYDDPVSGKKRNAYLDDATTFGKYWDTNQPYTSSMQSAFNDYLTKNHAKDDWYGEYQSKFGGDITKAGWKEDWTKQNRIGTYRPEGRVNKGYSQALSNWWGTLPQVWNNQELDDVMGAMPDDTRDTFGDWINNQSDDRYGLLNQYKMNQGQWGFEDPWNVDLGNISRAQSDYLKSLGYEADDSGAWTKPEVPEETPFDWSPQFGRLTPEQYDRFNAFNNDLTDYNISRNPETGEYGFGGMVNGKWQAPGAEYEKGMTDTIDRFLKQEGDVNTALEKLNTPTVDSDTNQPYQFNRDELVQDDQGNWVPDPSKYELIDDKWQAVSTAEDVSQETLDMLNEALGEYLTPFDSESANEAFTTGVYDPTMKEFEENTLPGIRESFAGGDLFSSAREKAETDSRTSLEETLASERAKHVYNAEQDHKNRGLSAMSVGTSLAQLPAHLAGQAADTSYKKAAAAAIFADIETQNALVNSQISNDELYALTMLMNIFDIGQQQQQTEWNTAFQNALMADQNLDFGTILQLIMGYQDQDQQAIVTY